MAYLFFFIEFFSIDSILVYFLKEGLSIGRFTYISKKRAIFLRLFLLKCLSGITSSRHRSDEGFLWMVGESGVLYRGLRFEPKG